ncbi:hypothetical protein SLEP1_g1458 [Rubroshorea leprosula]|uniref:Uncharacterized protein n=1 Tax=Rubroshorea leprosula TaxID=152421 RepID=A0AAV5HPQ4_9ROSI|nr:hypothetical protein SLEP1_g1458 [Rubroshorea leprosula]
MGNYMSCVHRSEGGTTGKVVLWDGTVQEFDGSLTVAELMLEHPQQVVVEFHFSVVRDKRPTPLPADKKLDVGKVYLMLAVKRGKPAALSSEEAQRVLLSANAVLQSRTLLSSSKLLPLFARIGPAVHAEQIQGLPLQKEECEGERHEEVESVLGSSLESLEGRPECLNRQISGKGWKPSLDTIEEKKVKAKVSHWLF